VALISTLINKTKMLEFGANFIGHMKYYEIPITLKKIISWKNTKSSIICKKSSKVWFQANICDVSFRYIKIVGIRC
jgi:hypothetical protein